MSEVMSFGFDGPVEPILGEARSRLAKHGGRMDGDATGGTFQVKGVEGKYSICPPNLTVTIVKKKFYQPMAIVKSIVRSQFEEICRGGSH
jgi:hypothetical protein